MTKDQQEEREQFIRVGTTLYKIVNQPSLSGGYIKKRIPWNIETLRQDYGKDYMASVPKYDGFCTVPQHLDYQPVVGKFLNLYEPISHKPMQGTFPYIESLVHHIFGEQYELGMDYLQLLYLQPVQKLPILLLVSEERNTGKSTFLNFLKAAKVHRASYVQNQHELLVAVVQKKNIALFSIRKKNIHESFVSMRFISSFKISTIKFPSYPVK